MNICITGLNYKRVRQIAISLAKKIDYDFVDVSSEFEPALLKASLYPIARSEMELIKDEILILSESSNQEDCVVSLNAEMFLPEGYDKILQKSFTIALLEKRKVDLALQKLIAEKCNLAAYTLKEILTQLKGKIKK